MCQGLVDAGGARGHFQHLFVAVTLATARSRSSPELARSLSCAFIMNVKGYFLAHCLVLCSLFKSRGIDISGLSMQSMLFILNGLD